MRPKIHLMLDWAVRCFGMAHVNDPKVRVMRMLEEAIETAQAYEVEDVLVHRLVNVVYQRPPGNSLQEIGGLMLTSAILAGVREFDIDDLLDAEIRRVLSKPVEHFTKRNDEKNALGLTGE